jgi:hypothetical protein
MPFLDYNKYPASQDSGGTMLGLTLLQAAQSGQGPAGLLQALNYENQAKQKQAELDIDKQRVDIARQQLGLEKTKSQQEAEKWARSKQAQDHFKSLIGDEGVNPGADPSVPLILAPREGTGLLGGKLTPEELRLKAAPDFFTSGDTQSALSLIGSNKSKYYEPKPVLDSSGKQVLVQFDDNGNTRQVQGYTPVQKNGTNLIVDPSTGQITFSQGGDATVTAPDGTLIRNPMMGPGRGGQGGTYVDPNTGKIISSDTARQTAMDQAAVAAVQRVEPLIDRLIKTLPQFQRATTKGKSAVQGLSNTFLGTNFQLPSTLAAGHSALNTVPEALLKAYGLQSTDKALDLVRSIVEPTPGESPENYKARVIESLNDMRGFSSQAKDRLAHGIVVQEGKQPNQAATPAPSMGAAELESWAQKTISQGANPAAVQARLKQIRGY